MLEYVVYLVVITGLYAALAISLDLVVNDLGSLSLSSAALAGAGAYIAVLCAPFLGRELIPCLIAAAVGGAVLALLAAAVTRSAREEEFAIATLGFQLVITEVLNNLVSVTNGPMGIGDIARPRLFNHVMNSPLLFMVVVILFLSVLILTRRYLSRGMWRVLYNALRSNELFAISCGVPTRALKMILFAVSGGLTAMAGGMLAFFSGYIDPASFGTAQSMLILSMLVIGGIGSTRGALAGAGILIIVPEALTFIGMPIHVAANVRQVMYGLILAAIVLGRPQGLFGAKQVVRQV